MWATPSGWIGVIFLFPPEFKIIARNTDQTSWENIPQPHSHAL
jgi:hypothetical protein